MTDLGQVAHVRAPQDNVSDDSYLLLSWNVANGQRVEQGDVLAEFETSKSAFELPSETSGFFYALAEVDQQVAVNELIAVIAPEILDVEDVEDFAAMAAIEAKHGEVASSVEVSSPPEQNDAEAQTDQDSADAPSGPGSHTTGVRFSKAAEEFIIANAVDRSRFNTPGLVRLAEAKRVVSGDNTPIGTPATLGVNAQVLGSSLVVIGGGGHGRMLLDLLHELRSFRIAGILDGGVPVGAMIAGHRVLGPDTEEELARLHGQGLRLAVNGVGGVTNRAARPAVWEKLKLAGFGLPNLVHPKAAVDTSVRLGEGVQILAGAYVGAEANLGDNCIINNGAVVSHDCVIAEHAHLTPGAILAGNVTVGSNSLIGMGASVYLGVSIGSKAIVTNGVDVFSDVEDGSVVRANR
jgi:sugar O-acyltransferase (sialic acid O-acetyltransferase NeuD family)